MKALIPIFAAILSTGCATIMDGSDQQVSITSQPPGANFEVRNSTGQVIHSGFTPNIVTLKRGDGYFKGAAYDLTLTKDGYAPQSTKLQPGISGWYFANIVFGGLIGLFAVDPATGAMYKLPETSNTTLTPVPTPVATTK